MLILLPLGHEARVQRFPYITVGLMLLNLAIFIPTYHWELNEMKKMDEIRRQILKIDPDYFYQPDPDDPRSRMIDEIAGRSFKLTQAQAEKLRELELKLEKIEKNMPFRRFGSTPSDLKPLNAVTYMFLHEGWFHLIGNMLFLWMVGCNIEDRWGPWFFGLFYIFGGVMAAVADAIARAGTTSADIPTIGASGAVAAVMGAFLVRYGKTRIKFFWLLLLFIYPLRGTFMAPAYIMLPLWFLREIIFAWTGLQEGVANWAHIGGFAFGALGGAVLWFSGLEEKYFIPKYSLDGEEHEVPADYQLAHELLAQGKREEAKQKFKQVAAQMGGYLPAYLILSKLYSEDKNREELIKVTEQIVKRSFDSDELHFALESYQRLTKAFPEASLGPVIQYRMATTFASVEMFQEAVWAYRNLSASYPGEVLAQKSLLAAGDLLAQKMNMPDNAAQMYQYLVQYYPGTPVADQAEAGLKRIGRSAQGPPGS